MPLWLESRRVEDGEDLKWGAVFRWRDLVVKFGGPSHRLRDRFRPSVSIRGADSHERLLPLPTPKPYAALEQRSWRGIESHLLVTEFIDGCFLHDVFPKDAHAVDEYARFLAEMHTRGIFHGDLHTLNTLWDGERWVVIDVKGFRGRLHRLRPARLIAKHWRLISSNLMRISGSSLPELRAFFDAYVEHSTIKFDASDVWDEVNALSEPERPLG